MLTSLLVLFVLLVVVASFSGQETGETLQGGAIVEVNDFARNNSPTAPFLDACAALINEGKVSLVNGPDPFVRYAFIEAAAVNYQGNSTVALVKGNEIGLRCEYTTRINEDDKELPYLERFFDKSDIDGAPVVCLAAIMYTKEQMKKEGIATEAEYAIIALNAEPIMGVSPMSPSTQVRNALGIEFGGNDSEIDREYHQEGVDFWTKWALVK
ncbi:TPA: DUF3228 family protein [Candidatus Poribacteria bacterium]|nr:DUF3228 family protein [Candidatus Poribacteria bacterium]